MPCGNTIRAEFTYEHDAYLTKYLARYCPSKAGRQGNSLYKQLEANVDNQWPWSVHHPWQSWRTRYVKNSANFDSAILKYQEKHNIKQGESLKRPAEPTPLGGPSAKRARVKLTQDEDSSSETRQEPEAPAGPSATSSSKPTSKQSRPSSSQARPAVPVSSTRSDDIIFTPFTPTPKSTRYPRPLSRPQPTAPVSRTRPNGVPVAPTTHDRTEEAESSTKWPPVRDHAGQKNASGPDVEAEKRHPFSQSQPPPGVEAIVKGEQARGRQKPSDPFARDLESERPAAAAQVSDKTRQQSPRPIEIEPRQDTYRNGRHERARSGAPVPSVDLVAVSSARSHSRSSTDASAPARAPRWSFPAFGYSVPWVFDQPQGLPSAPGSALRTGAISPFKWVAPSPVYGRTTSSPSGLPSSPLRAADPDTSNLVLRPRPSLDLSPHPPDVSLTASHGLASILDHMSSNHGMALTVVEAVYKRVGSLREADEVLKGMREAAESFGQKEIERRGRGRRRGERGRRGKKHWGTTLRYVAASDDGAGSEYTPPETSRAALWKRQSESASHTEEDEEGEKEDADAKSGSVTHSEEDREKGEACGEDVDVDEGGGEDEEEDREKEKAGGEDVGVGKGSGDSEEEEEADRCAVEAGLREIEDQNDGDTPADMPHDFSQKLPVAGGEDVLVEMTEEGTIQQDIEEQPVEKALVENKEAQKLEKQMGKDAFRKAVVQRFTFT